MEVVLIICFGGWIGVIGFVFFISLEIDFFLLEFVLLDLVIIVDFFLVDFNLMFDIVFVDI